MDQTELGPLLVRRLLDHPNLLRDMKRFVGIKSDATIADWRRNEERYPRGTALNKLWHFLAAAGIESPELVELQTDYPYGAYLSRLMAFNVITLEEATEYCGLKDTQSAIRIMRGQQTPAKPGLTLDELEELHGVALANAEQKLREKLGRKTTQSNTESARTTATAPPTEEKVVVEKLVSTLTQEGHGEINQQPILDLAVAIMAVHAQVMHALETYTPREIALLRKYANNYVIFDLSNSLGRMGSTRALTSDK